MPGPIGTNNDIGGSENFGQETGSAALLGRISGKLLSSNLTRNGIDLTVRNTSTSDDLLYVNVTSRGVGINTTPQSALDVKGYSHSTFGHVDDNFTIGNVTASNNSFVSSLVGNLTVSSSQVTMPTTHFDQVKFSGTAISSTTGNLVISSATQTVFGPTQVLTPLAVKKNVQVDGILSVGGTLYLGDSPVDVIVVNTDFSQSLVPHMSNRYNLGTDTKRWKNLFVSHSVHHSEIKNASTIKTNGGLEIDGDQTTITSASAPVVVTSPVDFTHIRVVNSSIYNLHTLESTGTGYVAIRDRSGMVIPSGTNSERQTSESGSIRWNTSSNYLEVYTGVDFENSMGSRIIESEEEYNDLLQVYTLVLG